MTSLTKNPHPPSEKIFFECRLENLPRHLMLQLGPQPEQERRYSRTKPRAFRRFFSRKSPKAARCQRVKQPLDHTAWILTTKPNVA